MTDRRAARAGAGRDVDARDVVAERHVVALEEAARIDGHHLEHDLAPGREQMVAIPDHPAEHRGLHQPRRRQCRSTYCAAPAVMALLHAGLRARVQPIGGGRQQDHDRAGRQEEERGAEQRADRLEVERQHLDGEAGIAEPEQRRCCRAQADADAAHDERQREDRKQDQVVERHAVSMNCRAKSPAKAIAMP